MKKESFTTRFIKRFYGITGPLDEFKRRKVDAISNICFMCMFYLIIFANLFVVKFVSEYPKIVAIAYPTVITLALFIIYFITWKRMNGKDVTEVSEEEWTPSEQRSYNRFRSPVRLLLLILQLSTLFFVTSALISSKSDLFTISHFGMSLFWGFFMTLFLRKNMTKYK